MNKIQEEKNIKKLSILNSLINDLTKYNNIVGYNNKKNYTIKINYQPELYKDLYIYSITILRGINNLQEIFNFRINSETKILPLLEEFINNIIKNENFLYTSFTVDSKTSQYLEYNINLKNNISLEIQIKDEEDLNMYKTIDKQFKIKSIDYSNIDYTTTDKDIIQKEKAIKIINLYTNFIKEIEEYNNIEDYNNVKPYKLRITNFCNIEKECYTYNFTIIRGDIRPEIILNLNINIQDNTIIYNEFYKLITELKEQDNYLQDFIDLNTYPNSYNLNLKNNVNLEYLINNETDEKFCTKLINNNQKKLKKEL